jgi:hypothetical protein
MATGDAANGREILDECEGGGLNSDLVGCSQGVRLVRAGWTDLCTVGSMLSIHLDVFCVEVVPECILCGGCT